MSLLQLLSSALESHGLYGEVGKCAGQSDSENVQNKSATTASLLIRAQNALRQILVSHFSHDIPIQFNLNVACSAYISSDTSFHPVDGNPTLASW